MAVRNFYVTGAIDGKATPLTGGPANKTGGFDLLIEQRNRLAPDLISKALTITGRSDGDALTIYVYDADGTLIYSHATRR